MAIAVWLILRRWERLTCAVAVGLIAGKPAPTGTALTLTITRSLWELACQR